MGTEVSRDLIAEVADAAGRLGLDVADRAGRNTKPFLLQTYRRDMGGGTFVLMKDVSAPVRVQGRHWGGLRIVYKA